ncbi:D-2-hydroxyacid dehydrogenase [Peribacillus sp. SCS-155]|uniref:D-2-hydroxyacid dehydrogenase n=1 Tax=Peribacillus sedimenti TaxID=3115297 RepID=UPI0039059294
MEQKLMIIAQNISQEYIRKIEQTAPGWTVLTGRKQEAWQDRLHEAEIIAGWKKMMEEYISEDSPALRWIQAWSAGVNSLPLRYFEEKGISISTASGVHAFPISETIFGLMLALTRKIYSYIRNQATKTWHHEHMNQEIHNKTIGIIGVGAIGKETAKIAKAFGMRVLGTRHSGKPEQFVDEMYTNKELHTILPQCDYVVITLPLTTETHHLFGSEEFKLMKTSSFLINIGRGEIVNEPELIQALNDGEIAGAGLDVFETEPLQAESPLWNMDNVIITPHTAGSTEFYDQRVLDQIFLPNLKSYISGTGLKVNVVDYRKGY